MSYESKSSLERLFYEDNPDPNFRSDHAFYGMISGKVNNPKECSKYKIDDPNSECLLQNASFFFKDAATCFKEKSIEVFVKESFTPSQL
jgi:hypothetical protein